VLAAKQHAALDTFRWALAWVVAPITGILLVVSLLPSRKQEAA
jgi:hypothetical protein